MVMRCAFWLTSTKVPAGSIPARLTTSTTKESGVGRGTAVGSASTVCISGVASGKLVGRGVAVINTVAVGDGPAVGVGVAIQLAPT